ncbi:hypothetical protein Mterra_03178 [Calidithermus terrae]|uniref:Outer membrane protein beta-barrel domain protein n=1 Tax=Calidithermus terrae TaxID=1408545 RepID=A0A399EEJ4_9DEIN|nr:hypothetical protein [Calidithermus terrae]RIH81410.1 hypothetical protein Mterra_03178 [Calidithermus terrae]
MTRALLVAALLGFSPALAQGITFYLGFSLPSPADLRVVQEGHPETTVRQARFESRDFGYPIYYGVRAWWGDPNGLRYELELIHQKLYFAGAEENGELFERFQVTDGFNLLTFNLAYALPAGPVRAVGRLGAGIALPHPETVVRGRAYGVDGDPLYYHFGGLAFQGGLGLEAPFGGFAAQLEGKFTFSHSRVQIAGGFVEGDFSTWHAVFGGGYRW